MTPCPAIGRRRGALLALAACASPSEEVSVPSGTISSPSAQSTDEPSTAPSSGTPTSASPQSSAGAPAGSGALDIQQRHPNGTLLRVLGITATATTTTVEIEAINGFTDEIELNSFGVHLADDLGNGYNFVEPQKNAKLAVPPAGTLTGTLTFLGKVDEDAGKLRLLLNSYNFDDTVDVESEYELSDAPSFQIDNIPIPGRS